VPTELDGSDIEIIYDDSVDVAQKAVIAAAEFEVAANATPGLANIILKDPDRELSFVTKRRIKLRIDGTDMWSGFVQRVGRSNFFSAGDGKEETKSRQWILRCVDNNILLDSFIFYNKANETKAVPDVVTNTMDGVLLKRALDNYSDFPSYIGRDTYIDDVRPPAQATISTTNPWAWPQVASKMRAIFEDLSLWSAAVFYVGPDDEVHYHALQDVEAPWGFSDRPNLLPIAGSGGYEGSTYGFREASNDSDGTEIITDAFVWGGGAPVTTTTKFARATDSDLEDIHGKWQMAETHFNERNFKTQENVTIRANMIVFGNPDGTTGGAQPGSVAGEGPRGLRFDQPSVYLTWHTRNVPFLSGTRRHLYPGDLVAVEMWAWSEDDGATPYTKLLPLRKLNISFPSGAKEGKAHVRFNGYFDLRNDDSFALWKYLRKRRTSTGIALTIGSATSADDGANYGDLIQMTPPAEAVNGSNTVFTFPFASGAPGSYVPGTSTVFDNGIAKHADTATTTLDYAESDPENGEVTFHTAPASGHTLLLQARALG